MQSFTLNAQKRNVLGKKVKKMRLSGQLPAVVYGGKKQSQPLTLNFAQFDKLYREAGSSAIVSLVIDDSETDNVLIQSPQYNVVTGLPQHIDFLRINMDKKIKTEIPLVFVGESKAVEQLGGTLVTPHNNVEVECLPKDLVQEIEIDISKLVTFEDQIKFSDITIPNGIELQIDPSEVIALVDAPRSEEEMAELETATTEEEQKAVEAVAGETEEPTEDSEGDSTPADKDESTPATKAELPAEKK